MSRDKVSDFNHYKVAYVITGKVFNETPLRVGLGKAEQLGSPTDLPVIKMRISEGKEIPYIPGSSLKGVFRSYVEKIAAAIYGLESIHSPFDSKRAESEYEDNRICAVCGIFGSTKLASHVIVKDAFPLSNTALMLKPGIGINRDFGGVQPGIGPFVEEYVPSGLEWSFGMNILNINLEDKQGEDPRPGLLKQLISSLRKGELQVGGRKSVGSGIITLKELKTLKRFINPSGEFSEIEVNI
ncbi:MAG: RAMP superfamily CRISPR-associated protein [Nitrososphaerota archaeon]